MTTLGIDVSAAQGHIDWVHVARWLGPDGERVEFAIVKATEGVGYVDPQLKANSSGADACRLLLGWYHFAHPASIPHSDPETQAAHFVDTARSVGFQAGRHLLALDVEEARKIHPGPDFDAWVHTFVAAVERLGGVTPWVYGGKFFLEGELAGGGEGLARCPLWLPAYVAETAVARYVPQPWTDWTLWQRSGDQAAADCSVLRVDGIATNVDRDEFRGTIDELRDVVAGCRLPRTEPAPPPEWHVADAAEVLPSIFSDALDSSEPTLPGTPTSKSSQSMRAVKG